MKNTPPRVIGSALSGSYEELLQKARDMRNSPTPAEDALWQYIKGQQLGHKFRRQHIINGFIVDFYCLQPRLVIEVDGDIHNAHIQRDKGRTEILQSRGCRILRFKNNDILNNIENVLRKIKTHLNNPSPLGEGKG